MPRNILLSIFIKRNDLRAIWYRLKLKTVRLEINHCNGLSFTFITYQCLFRFLFFSTRIFSVVQSTRPGFPWKDARLLKYKKSMFRIILPSLSSLSRSGILLFFDKRTSFFFGKLVAQRWYQCTLKTCGCRLLLIFVSKLTTWLEPNQTIVMEN